MEHITMETFINKNKTEIDNYIGEHYPDSWKITNRERRILITNDKELFNWAKSEGVSEDHF